MLHPYTSDKRGEAPVSWRVFWVLLCVLAPCFYEAAAQHSMPAAALHLAPGDTAATLAGRLDLLIDATGNLTIEDVTAPAWARRFVPAPEGVSGGCGKSASCWMRFQVFAEPGAEQAWLLVVPADEVTVYAQAPGGTWETRRTGFMLPVAERDVEHGSLSAVRLGIGERTTRQVYVRLHYDEHRYATTGRKVVPVLRAEPEAARADRALRLGQGIFYGILIALLGYNLFLFFSLRDRSYLYYVLFLAVYTFFWAAFFGYVQEFYWPAGLHSHPALLFHLIPAGFVFYLLFARAFLQTRTRAPGMHRLLNALLAAQVLPVVPALLGSWFVAQNALALLSLATMLGTLVVALRLVRQRYRPARFFLAACLFFVVGTVAYTLMWMQVLPAHVLTVYAPQIGTVFEAFLFSLGLADRVNVLRAEKELAQDQARRAEALTRALQETSELKTQLLGLVAHDLRSPLAGIYGFAEMLREDLADDPRAAEPLAIVEESAGHLLGLVDDLLDTVAIESGQIQLTRQPVDVGCVAEGVIRAYQPRARAKNQVLHLHAERTDTLFVAADEGRLRDVMDNLVSNAVKYAPPGSPVVVRVEAIGGHIRFMVRDEGPGLTEQDMSRLFGPFQRLSARPTGNEPSPGLGLAIAKKLVEMHDGCIWVESSVGHGSTFGFDLPALSSVAASTAA